MIIGSKKNFYDRCIERGYTLDEVRPCIISENATTIIVDEYHPKYPHKKLGLGDIVTKILSWIGITEKKINNILGIKNCGCQKRRLYLNRIGRKLGIG